MPLRGKRRLQRTKGVVSLSKFKKLVLPRPDVLHGYLRHRDINQYLEYLQHRYPFVEVHTLGTTYEHRQLKAIEINWYSAKNKTAQEQQLLRRPIDVIKSAPLAASQNAADRNIIFIEGGTHAREWITISVALNCIYQLTEKYLRHFELLRKLRFVIVPVSNPDGYEYTWTKNRRWRKNRRPHGKHKYIGTDCNRNYDIHWEEGPSKVNRNTYKGTRPFSEPETRALRNALIKYAPNLLFFLSLHSYAQSIMYPWAYSKDLPESWSKLEKLALCGRNAIKAYNGRTYRVGSIARTTKHRISGSIVDYAFGVIQVPLALVMELPSASMGFQPPAEAISPIGHESWFGIREMCKTAFDLVPRFEANELQTERLNKLREKLTNCSTNATKTTTTITTNTSTTTNDKTSATSNAASIATSTATSTTAAIMTSITPSTVTSTATSIASSATLNTAAVTASSVTAESLTASSTSASTQTTLAPLAPTAMSARAAAILAATVSTSDPPVTLAGKATSKLSTPRAMAITAAEISDRVHNRERVKKGSAYSTTLTQRAKPNMNANNVPVKC